MNKMMNPEMEVVRFGAEDVIATSFGVQSCSAGDHLYYSTFGPTKAEGTYYRYVNDQYYKNGLPNGFSAVNQKNGGLIDTWYHKDSDGSWYICEEQHDFTNPVLPSN